MYVLPASANATLETARTDNISLTQQLASLQSQLEEAVAAQQALQSDLEAAKATIARCVY